MSFVHEHRDGAEECCLQMDCLCRSGGSRGEVCRVLGNHGHRRLNCPKSRATDAGWGAGETSVAIKDRDHGFSKLRCDWSLEEESRFG